ncbi:hypothetical protein EDB86DRAFT_3180712 [Lactarius hatsudake]|nr:hypothetical protein EDB86DRAFT_3180712 [Lactarius hatsudake]
MLSPSLPAVPHAMKCHCFALPAMPRALPCRSLSPPAMPRVPTCHPISSLLYAPRATLPPLTTPRALPSQPHLFKLATVPTDQQGASRPESLSNVHPLRIQMPPRPSSTAIQSPALCFTPSQDHPPTPRIRVPRSLSMYRAKQIRDFSLCSSSRVGPVQPTSVAVITSFPSAEGSKLGGGPTSAAERTSRESSSQQTAFPSAVNWQILKEKEARAPHAVPPLPLRPRALTPRPRPPGLYLCKVSQAASASPYFFLNLFPLPIVSPSDPY